jgi:citrate synthase
MASQSGHVQAQEGLEGVVAGTSAICFVDGTQGRLVYRGYDAEVLAQQSTFEEVAYLLWHGDLPTRAALEGLDLARRGLTTEAAILFAIGTLVSAGVGYATVKYFIRYLAGHSLNVFAVYRCVVAAGVLVWWAW